VSEAQRADGRRNRERILAAADDLLRRDPRFAMADLARSSGLTRATLYRHFADREAVLDALAQAMAAQLVPAVLGALEELPLADALDRLAHDVVTVAAEHAHLIDAQHRHLEEMARLVVPDEPIAALLAERRARGELTSSLDDAWLAHCIRALCLSALADERSADLVAADLAQTLRLLVSAP
jgi:AcrR family transcriptional regulator